MVLDPDRNLELIDRLLEVVAADAVRKDRHRLVEAARPGRFQWLAHGRRSHRRRFGDPGHDRAVGATDPHLRRFERPAQGRIDHLRQRLMDGQAIAVVNLDEHIEGGGRLAFEHGLLRPAASRLLIREGHGLNAAEEVVEGWVDEQVLQRVAVRGRDQLHPTLGDGARRHRFQLDADLVDHDHLRHVVLDRFDHDGMLQGGGADLHPPRAADPGVRNVTVATDLVGGVDDDHPLLHLIGEHAGALAEHRRLPNSRAAEQEDALSADDHILDNVDRPGDGPTHAAGQADNLATAVADRGNAVERPLDAGPVVVTEGANARGYELEVFRGDGRVVEDDLVVRKASLGLASEVEHHLQQQPLVIETLDRPVEMWRQRLEEQVELRRVGVGQTVVGSPEFVYCFSHIGVPVACL